MILSTSNWTNSNALPDPNFDQFIPKISLAPRPVSLSKPPRPVAVIPQFSIFCLWVCDLFTESESWSAPLTAVALFCRGFRSWPGALSGWSILLVQPLIYSFYLEIDFVDLIPSISSCSFVFLLSDDRKILSLELLIFRELGQKGGVLLVKPGSSLSDVDHWYNTERIYIYIYFLCRWLLWCRRSVY